MEVKVKCRKCGRLARAADFVLDPIYRMMVCPSCVKERRISEDVRKEFQAAKAKKAEQQKPKDYDVEDEYLEKAYNAKLQNIVKVEKVDDEKVKYRCPKCRYTFLYNVGRS